ncbi:hypothetical protein [Helicobacter sp. 13S00477-4]|uniref:phage adaptor protein n=1 Tax=Helicobacter sp. 13S00477-4 TaxID=1905759 RepID=UPI000BA6C99D|nr:hypothetical protein [Helicobacter sp. 13S00477-4]PAF51984.1 hypothetical protein BKH44_04810 [Helicobacter sp. 13S00477-4]
MIQVQDIILSLRSRLRDKAVQKEYSDNELLDLINMAYITIATRLKVFSSHIEFDLSQLSNILMPIDCIALINVFYDSYPIDILPTNYLLKNKLGIKTLSCTLKGNQIELYPPKDTGILAVDYHFIKRILGIEDYLQLSDFYKEAILFYCMFLALQKETRVDSIQKSQYYQSLYELEIQKIALINSEINTTADLTTQYQRI